MTTRLKTAFSLRPGVFAFYFRQICKGAHQFSFIWLLAGVGLRCYQKNKNSRLLRDESQLPRYHPDSRSDGGRSVGYGVETLIPVPWLTGGKPGFPTLGGGAHFRLRLRKDFRPVVDAPAHTIPGSLSSLQAYSFPSSPLSV